MITRKLILRDMLSHCCEKLVRRILAEMNVAVVEINMGEVELKFDPKYNSLEKIILLLEQEGFELVQNKEAQLVEQIKSVIVDLVHHSTFNAMVRNSDYLVEKFNLSYQHISGIFSKHEPMTLEKFIIMQKIEKVKELIRQGEMTLSEIAHMMGYSSVQYLSTQFKNVTGISVSDFRKVITEQTQTDGF